MTMADGTAVTARTRNGLLGVFKLGDANGDDKVNIMDVVGAVSLMNGSEDEGLIPEVANTNGDDNINIMDVVGIIEIMNNNETENEENE